MKKINYKKIYNFVKGEYEKTKDFKHGPFDETYYTLRVYESAKEIISKLKKKVNVEQILVAALFHDIGKTKLDCSKLFGIGDMKKNRGNEWHRHPKLSLPIAKKYLKKHNFPNYFIEDVLYLIVNHDKRGDKLENRTLELEILQDADVVADIGYAGFLKAFLYSGKFSNNSVVSTIQYISEHKKSVNYKKINLKVSKDIAKREMKIQKDLIKEVVKDIQSDLL